MLADEQPMPAPVGALLTALRGMYALSAEMLSRDTRDDILDLALSSFPSWGRASNPRHLSRPERRQECSRSRPVVGTSVIDCRIGCPRRRRWFGTPAPGKSTWANSMRSGADHLGYIVVTADDMKLRSSDRFLLDVFATQTAVALHAAQQAAQVFAANEARVLISSRLGAAIAELSRRTHAHDLMTAAALGGDVAALLGTAHVLIQLPVAIVDQFGHLQASAEDVAIPDVWSNVRMPEPTPGAGSGRRWVARRVCGAMPNSRNPRASAANASE